MSRTSPRSGRATGRAPTAVALVLLTALTACSGGDEEPDEPAAQEPTAEVDALPTTLRAGKVEGRLPKQRVDNVVARVGAVVDGWIDAGFAGEEWPRKISGAYAEFTERAAAQASGDAELTSAAAFSQRVDSVEVTERVVRVDLVSHRRTPAGATARVRLTLETSGEVERTVRVRGRLFLTPSGNGWKIFGYDLTQGGQ